VAKKKKKSLKKEKPKKKGFFSLPKKIKKTLSGIFLILISVIVLFSFFGLSGVAGEYFKKSLIYLFGRSVFIIPIILFLSALIIFKTKYKRFSLGTIIGSFLILFGISGFFEAISKDNGPFKSINGFNEGGLFGKIIGSPLVNFFDFWISIIVFSTLLISGIIILVQLLKTPLALREEKPTEKPIESKIFKKIIGRGKEFSPSGVGGHIDIPKPKEELKLKEAKTKKEEIIIDYKLPSPDLLESDKGDPIPGDTNTNKSIIKNTLGNFDIPVEMSETYTGPTVTQYTLKPSEGIKLSRITSLSNDLSLALAAQSIRIEAPIPGRSLVGVEVPNKIRAQVRLKSLIENIEYRNSSNRLLIGMGKDVSGEIVYSRLEKMPHLLVAGSTGSGKTIFLNTLILSLLFRNTPENLRLILIDPKRVEFRDYDDIPHLLCPVIFDVTRANNALKWLAGEMERRLKVMSETKTRDIGSYNDLVSKKKKNNPEELEIMPYIVLIIDELADLMVGKGKEIEPRIVRIAQMARAAGIHLVLATQRPSVEVITGLIKANIISRVAFQVASQVDSRTIIDVSGAEKLLGSGDMLFVSNERSKPRRVQAPFVSDKEIKGVINWIKSQYEKETEESDSLSEELEKGLEETNEGSFSFVGEGEEEDNLYEEAKNLVVDNKKASASFLQRRLRIGYARAARLIDIMEDRGVVGPGDGAKAREIYLNNEEDENGDNWKRI
jgi:DNA segregation ATPase FtsK/SpoIIIE, S-DNA-T family